MPKIYVIGSVASGKTTLAKQLSNTLKIPWYELDNVVHERLKSGDRKRRPEERDIVFNGIIDSEPWIIEGVWRDCFDRGFEDADIIILLDTPTYVRKYRIATRWIRQRLKLEKAHYRPTLKMLSMMYRWSNVFERTKGRLFKVLQPYEDKVIILKNNNNIEGVVKKYKIENLVEKVGE
ncbi:P-loop NTPase family protein [Alkaliphilus hydrothermalis]|uniref:Adenylate kinase family enzyme n=1 Tax=Alkaliphilus hydrothermalis TaxID=1482730 RepID=A0ABS2NMT0_9FIRM|nr:AAA family ATPase [Alkaliphilus hydrothermalis]MBM7614238.1 adenylate kinase family enzyme [Alkaliphilus hydrothermalis]